MTGVTRGRLPARVYWVRRLMVLGIATLLVVGIAKLLGGSSDGSAGGSGGDRAAPMAQTSSVTDSPASSGASTPGPTDPGTTARKHRRAKQTPQAFATPVVMPSGHCAQSDVAITPSVPKPVAGGDIALVFDISSVDSPACYWTMSGKTMALKITSGPDEIWSTTDCARAVPPQDLVLRQAQPTRVKITWDARRSEPGCPAQTEWALPGTYHLHVAALAGQPQDVAFLLTAPSPAQVTRTADPKQHHGKKKHPKPPPG